MVNYTGYMTPYGYVGCIFGEWVLFATEEEYYERIKEIEEESNDEKRRNTGKS